MVGIDINKDIVDQLNSGKLPFEEPGLKKLFEEAKTNFIANTTLESSDVYIIAVPTPLEKDMKMADLSMIKNAAENIANVLTENQIVLLESTVPPGTSKNFILPILQKNNINSVYYAHCPERAIPGKTLHEMIYNDRIIGGLDEESTKKAKQLYQSFVKGNIYLTDHKTAEFVKLMENTFRDINIALANEFSLMAEEVKIDAWEAIDLANKHPRVNILKPGPGVGGHCIAIDPHFLAEKSSKSRIVTLAREINESMPAHVIKLTRKILGDINNPTITLLGLSYKGNVEDVRESPAFKIRRIAESEGMHVKVYDPHITKGLFDNSKTLDEAIDGTDCIILVTDHEIFKEIDPNKLIVKNKNIIDTRNILDHKKWKEAGFHIKVLGNGKN